MKSHQVPVGEDALHTYTTICGCEPHVVELKRPDRSVAITMIIHKTLGSAA